MAGAFDSVYYNYLCLIRFARARKLAMLNRGIAYHAIALVHSAVHAEPSYGYIASYSFTRSSSCTSSLAEVAEELSYGALHVSRYNSYIRGYHASWTSGYQC